MFSQGRGAGRSPVTSAHNPSIFEGANQGDEAGCRKEGRVSQAEGTCEGSVIDEGDDI